VGLVHCISRHGLNRDKYHIRKYALFNCDTIAVTVKLRSHCILMHGLPYGTRMYWKNVSLQTNSWRSTPQPTDQYIHTTTNSWRSTPQPTDQYIHTTTNSLLNITQINTFTIQLLVGTVHSHKHCITLTPLSEFNF